MDKWEEFTLSEISEKIGDGIHGTPKYDINGKYYFINGNNLSNGKIVFNKNTLKVSTIEYEKIKKPLNKRTILVSINGTLGNVAAYNNEDVCLGKSACYINLKKNVCKDFIKYYLDNDYFMMYADAFSTGSTIKNLPLKAVRNFKIKIPNIDLQKKISKILSNYDDLINCNLEKIKLLDELAKITFEEFFLRFKIDNKKLNINQETKIPSGWKKIKLIEYLEIISKGPSLNYNLENSNGVEVLNQSCLRNGEIELEKILIAKELNEKKAFLYLRLNDILINSMGEGTLGRVSKNVSIDRKMIIHNCITLLRAKDIYSQYLLFYFISAHQKYFEAISHGSTGQSTLKKELISKLIINLPDIGIMRKFDKIVSPIWKKIGNLKKQNIILKEAKDILLPRLLFGKSKYN